MSVIVIKMRKYVESSGEFRYVHEALLWSICRGLLSDVLANSYLDSAIYSRWSESFSFEYREVRKRKGCNRGMCPFCVRVVFDRVVGGYVFKVYRLPHLDHVVNFSSIVDHVKFEADLSSE